MDYLWWKCPRCNQIVNFEEQLKYVFSDSNEADFTPESGLWFHTIFCETCGANWVLSIGEMNDTEVDEGEEAYKEHLDIFS